MKIKSMLTCLLLGLVLVFLAVVVGCLSSMDDPPWWTYVVLFFVPYVAEAIRQKFKENAVSNDWHRSWKNIKRNGYHQHIRISFSYLFRIKFDDKYLLVKNSHGTELFQPVGGVYKYNDTAKAKLRKLGAVEDSGNVIRLDASTKNDFRLRVETKKLAKFIRWFQKGVLRETVSDLSREFSEELIESGILSKSEFSAIEYTYIGQHISDICPAKFDRSLNELFIADIVEISLTPKQNTVIRQLQLHESSIYYFATEQMILCNKTQWGPDNNKIDIADHSFKILEVTESDLNKKKYRKYTIAITV